MEMLSGPEAGKGCRNAEIMADAAYAILCKNPATTSGNFFIDDEVLAKEGITDFKQYLCDPCTYCTSVCTKCCSVVLSQDRNMNYSLTDPYIAQI